MIKTTLKRSLSMILALVMVFAMVPASIFNVGAAEVTDPEAATAVGDILVVKGSQATPANPSNVPGTHWEFVGESDSTTCGEHVHGDGDCRYTCPHAINGKHVSSCYGGTWQYCPTNDGGTCDHTTSETFDRNALMAIIRGTSSLDTEVINAIIDKYGSGFSMLNAINKRFCYKLGDTLICDHQAGYDVHNDSCCSKESIPHEKPRCYSYTWELIWDSFEVDASVEGNDSVTIEKIVLGDDVVADGKLTYGESIKITLSDPGEIGWVATVFNGETQKTSKALTKGSTTEIDVTGLTSGKITVKLSRETIYTVTLKNNTPEYGTASVDLTEALNGDTITVTTTPKDKTDNIKYSLESIVVNGTPISGNTFVINGADVTVEVTFKMEALNGNDSAEILFNPAKTAADQLDALKQEIFNKLAVGSVPAGITYDQLTYEHKYYQTWTAGGYLPTVSQSDEYVVIGVDPADKDVTVGYYTTHPFGYTGIGAVEHVKLTYELADGTKLFIEADVTLADSRPTTTINVTGSSVIIKDSAAEVTADVVKAALSGTVTNADWSAVYVDTLPTYDFPADAASVDVTVTLKLDETVNYQGTSTTATVTIYNPVYNPTIVLNGGNVTLKVYSDAACTTEVDPLTELEPGTYYVKVEGVAEGYDIETVAVTGAQATGTDGVYSIEVVATAGQPATTYTVSATAEKLKYNINVVEVESVGGFTVLSATTLEYGSEIKITFQLASGAHDWCFGYFGIKDGFGSFHNWDVDESRAAEGIYTISTNDTTLTGDVTLELTAEAYLYIAPNGGTWKEDGSTETKVYTLEYGKSYAVADLGLADRISWPGYAYDGLVGGQTTFQATGNTITVSWKEATGTKYIVNHYQQNLNGGYDLYEFREAFGTTNAEIVWNDVKLSYTGFNAKEWTETYTIAADGSTVVNIYYDRITYTITWVLNGATANLYGEPLTLPTSAVYNETVEIVMSRLAKDGYKFTRFASEQVTVQDIGHPDADRDTYSFTMPAEDVTIEAVFEIKTYTIKFVDENGNLIGEAQIVKHGEKPVIPQAPEKADTVEWNYTFDKWLLVEGNACKNCIIVVEGEQTWCYLSENCTASDNATYKATYSAEKQKYTITWKVLNDTYTTSVEYGTVPTAPDFTMPTKHTFVDWDATLVAVTGEATYTAVVALEVTNGKIYINKNYTGSGNPLALTDLRKNVLTAAGLDHTLGYVVTTSIGVDTKIFGVVNVILQINADNTIEMLNPGISETAFNAAIAAINAISSAEQVFSSALDNDSSRTFTITSPEGVSANVTMQITDTRTAATLNHNGTEYTASNLGSLSLDIIKGHMSSNATISSVVWETPDQVLVPGQDNTVYVIVTLVATGDVYVENEGKYRVEITVYAPHTQATITVPSTGEITYNTSMTDFDKATNVWNALNPQFTPAGGKYTYEIFYLANKARNVDLTINFNQMDLGTWGTLIKRVLGDSITVQIPVENKWMNIGEVIVLPEAPSNERIEEILMNDLLPSYGTKFLNGELSTENMKDVLVETLQKYPDIAEYYEYLGAHYFGENDEKDADGNVLETVYVKVYNYTIDDTNNLGDLGSETTTQSVITLGDTRTETEIKLNSGVTVTYGKYTEAELLALIFDGVYANGTKIDGLTVEFVTDVIGLPASEGVEVTVKFKGDSNYKPSTATTTIVINKAPASVSVDNQVVKYGTAYNKLPVITSPAGVDTIQFIVGLDISGFNVDPSAGASVSAIKGLLGNVQLLLPEELQDMLVMADEMLGLGGKLKNGASIKLSELKEYVALLNGKIPGYEEYFAVLFKMLDSLPTETADIEVRLGGTLPTNIGAYLIGAVTADSNYETAFGAGILVIYPDGIRAELAWNQNDENYIITNSLLSSGAFDTGAHATSVGEGGNIADATAQIVEIFLGVDIDAEIILTTDPGALDVGAYVEIAIVANWGNQMYYSMPIARPIVVVAETLDVDFVDSTGAVNNDRHFEFFNIPQNGMEGNLLVTYKQDGNGYKAGDVVTLPYTVKYLYAGIQTNGQPYASETAPTHAGVYTITAIVVVRDGDRITHAGQGIGALVIEPSKSTIDVENEAVKYDGNEHTVNQFVDADSVNVPGLKPDTTIISAGISANLDANIGLEAIEGNVNIDMPKWLDDIMKKYGLLEAGYANGITVDTFRGYIANINDMLTDLGVELDAFNKIVDVIDQLPGTATLTFLDNKGYTNPGVYLIIGIVTDSDHYPSADAGIMVIYPDAEKVELKYNETWDGNNVFTQAYLKNYDLNAQAYYNGAFRQDFTDRAINLFVGFADHGELILTKNKAELDNGVYAEVSFLLVMDNVMYYAEPISREVIILPNNADIDFTDGNGNVNNDRHFVFNNQSHAMNTIRVTLVDGTVLDLKLGDNGVAIYYVGVQSNGKPYASYEAPTHAGIYEVTAQYTERDAQDRVINLGVGVGVLVIEPAKAEIKVENSAEKYENGKKHDTSSMITVTTDVPGVTPAQTIITAMLNTDGTFSENGLAAIEGTVNVDLPAWLDNVIADYNIFTDGLTAAEFIAGVAQVEAKLAELGITTDALDGLAKIAAQLPADATITFKDQAEIAPEAVGAYLVIGVVTDSNFYPAMDAGVLVIYPDVRKTTLAWKYNDSNNIFTLDTLEHIDLGANAAASEANALVKTLFIGVDASDWTITLVDSQTELNEGVYSEFAFLKPQAESVIYYAEPIARVITVVPNVYDININGEKVTHEFDNTGKDMGEIVVTTMTGEPVDINNGTLKVVYVGVDTQLRTYYSTEKPVHAGTYTVVALYIGEDADGDKAVGVGIGQLIITPADVEINVDSHAGLYGQDYNFEVTTKHEVKNDEPKTLVIIAGLDMSAYTTEGKLGIDGTVNVDFPEVIDNILKELFPELYVNGIGTNAFFAKYDEMVAAIEAAGYSADHLKQLKTMLEKLNAANLTFNETAKPTETGLYAVIAMVFDPDYKFDVDTALIAIAANATVADLDFNAAIPSALNILPYELLEKFDFGAHVEKLLSTDSSLKAEDIVVNDVIFGLTADFELFLGSSESKPTQMGIYDQVAYAPAAENNVLAILPILRFFTVADSSANVVYVDPNGNVNWLREFEYDGTAKDMGASIMLADGTILDVEPTLWYLGIQDGCVFYSSTEAPTEVGLYQVIGYYADADQNIYTVGLGAMRIKDATTKKLWGDVNSDGEVTTYDAVLLLRYIAELEDETGLDLSVADVSGESGYTTFDAVLICQYVAEMIEKFPVEE